MSYYNSVENILPLSRRQTKMPPHKFFSRQFEGIRIQVALARGPCTAYLFDFVNEFCQMPLLSRFLFSFFCWKGFHKGHHAG